MNFWYNIKYSKFLYSSILTILYYSRALCLIKYKKDFWFSRFLKLNRRYQKLTTSCDFEPCGEPKNYLVWYCVTKVLMQNMPKYLHRHQTRTGDRFDYWARLGYFHLKKQVLKKSFWFGRDIQGCSYFVVTYRLYSL